MPEKNDVKPLVPLPDKCVTARFLRRIKRFTVEAETATGKILAHTNNTGSMLGLAKKGSQVLLSPASSQARKLKWTLERVSDENDHAQGWIGVNTSLPNILFKAAFEAGQLDFAEGYTEIFREVKCGLSRMDVCLKGFGKPVFWIECKNVSLVEDGIAAFPDAQSERACKHIQELMEIKKAGMRAAMFFLVQRNDCCAFAPADYIDIQYASLFYQALAQGVEMLAYCADFTASGTNLGRKLPIMEKMF